MKSLITFITAVIALCVYASGAAKRNISLPDSYVYYIPVYDSAHSFTNFDIEIEKLDEWSMNRSSHVLAVLDSFKILNGKSDTVFDVRFDRGDCKPFSYMRTRKDTVLERYSRCMPSSYRLSPAIVRLAYYFDGNPEERFGPEILDNPDSVLLSIIYRRDFDAVSDFFKYGMTQGYSIDVYRYILNDSAIVDIQRLRGLNKPFGQILAGSEILAM